MNVLTDDWQLLEAYATQRSQAAFARLVARYSDLVYHTALRRTRRAELSEDVAQAVFIALARSAARLRPRESLGAWLHQTTLCAAASALRSESRRRRHEHAAATPDNGQVRSDAAADDPAAQVEAALHRLRSRDRQVLALHYLEGRTMSQTAAALGITIEAARKRLTRALERLRDKLGRRGGGRNAALGATAVASALAAVTSGPAAHVSASQIAADVIAGGSNGNAFTLASQVLRAKQYHCRRSNLPYSTRSPKSRHGHEASG